MKRTSTFIAAAAAAMLYVMLSSAPAHAQCPPAPTLTATGGPCKATLSWTVAFQAIAYEVHRSTTGVFTDPPIATVFTTNYTDNSPPAGTVYYAVRGVGPGPLCPSGLGALSSSQTATVSTMPPSPVMNLAAPPACNGATATWNAVPDATAYDFEFSVGGMIVLSAGQTTTNSATYTHVSGSRPDTVRIRAVNNCGAGEWVSTSVQIFLSGPTLSSGVDSVGLGPGVAMVTWPMNGAATSYEVRRSDGAVFSATESPFLDISAPMTGSFNYCVAAVNACGPGGQRCDNMLSGVSYHVLGSPATVTGNVHGNVALKTMTRNPGGGTLLYQWWRDGGQLPEGGGFTGTATPNLAVSDVRMEDAGPFELRVRPAGNFRGMSCFVTLVVVNPCPGDFNASGETEINDIFLFLNAWFAGCP